MLFLRNTVFSTHCVQQVDLRRNRLLTFAQVNHQSHIVYALDETNLIANMNSDILLQTVAIFFLSNSDLKTGYWFGVCHGWARITKWKIIVHCGIRTQDPPLTKRARYPWATRTNVCRVDKSLSDSTCVMFRNLPVACGRCSKIICR